MSGRVKQTSVLLEEKQIDFLRNLCNKIEREGHMKMSLCKMMKVLINTLTCIKPKIPECRNEEETERELLRCFKKAAKKLKK